MKFVARGAPRYAWVRSIGGTALGEHLDGDVVRDSALLDDL